MKPPFLRLVLDAEYRLVEQELPKQVNSASFSLDTIICERISVLRPAKAIAQNRPVKGRGKSVRPVSEPTCEIRPCPRDRCL